MVGTRLTELLKEKNMTQKELSIKAKARPSTISALCNGTAKTISFKLIDSLCTALDCHVGDLFQQVEDRPQDDIENWSAWSVRKIYQNTLGTTPSKIEKVELGFDEYMMLQQVLNFNYALAFNINNNSQIISINNLKNRIVQNLTETKDDHVCIWLSNDSFLDDFTQVIYYIVKTYKNIDDFEDNKQRLEDLYLNFINKIDDKTFDKILELIQ